MPRAVIRARRASSRRRSASGAGTAGAPLFCRTRPAGARGGDLGGTPDCTEMSSPDPATANAIGWWVSLVRDDHAALYDPYGGSQTGVPGDPFLAGAAAMGSNGWFAVGQLN